MNHLLRRFLATGALLAAALAAPLALATPTISFTGGVFPATGSPVALSSTPAGLNISVTAAPTAGATITQVSVTVNGASIGSATGSSPFVVNWVPTTAGTFTIAATVNDTSAITTGAGASTNTATINSIVTVTAARAATLVAPTNNSVLAAGSQIFLRSTASMTDGIVQKVDFILDGNPVPIATATQAPYNVAHTITAGTGAHTLLARATASDGTTTFDSSTINFTVGAAVGTAPAVTLTGPVNGAFVATGSAISLAATATDTDGFIPSTVGGGVTFFVDGEPVGTDLTAPYSVSWTPTVTKSYSIRAQAIDDKANIVLSTAATVTAVSALPTITLTSPTTANVGTAVTLSASATASPGATITQVEFLENGVLIGAADTTAPYAVSWTPATIGTSVITARVTDTANAVVTSSAVNVTVSAALPTITFTAPSSVAVNSLTTLTATATPGTGATITQVQFLSGTTVLGTDTTAPYSFDWTPTVTGTVSLTARVTDANGTSVTSSASSVTVAAAVPTVAIAIPTNGTSLALGAPATLTATATGNGGATVNRVDFFAGATTIGTALSAPYTITWTPTASGVTAVTARVTDSNGVTATSIIVNVLVTAPAVALTAPSAGSNVTVGTVVALTAAPTAVAPATVTRVDFFAGTTLVDSSMGPAYTVNWTPATAGAVSLTARVTDSNGATTTSAAVGVTVAAAAGPTVSVSAPSAGAVVTVGSNVSLTANATAGVGATIAQVQFLVGTTIIGTDTTFPFGVTWIPGTAGNFSITARVIDSLNNTVTSAAIAVTANTATAVALTAPAANSAATIGTPVTLTASPTASLGNTIAQVTFFANGTQIGAPVTTSPYTISWTPTTAGAVALTATATDSAAVTATSAAVNVTVSNSQPVVALLTPTVGTVSAVNAAVTLTATATAGSNATVTRVDYFAGTTFINSATVAPYTATWLPTTAGAFSLTARVLDSNGNLVTSAPVSVTIAATVPTVALIAPAAGANVALGTTTTLTASAATNGGATVSRVDFLAGTTPIGTSLATPFSISWTPTTAGANALTARVTDSNGVSVTSAIVNVNVTAPSVTLTSPTAGSSVAINAVTTLTATASAVGAATVTKVEFLAGTTLIGTDTTSPYDVVWTPNTSGAAALTARVTDSNGAIITSTSVSVTVAVSGLTVALTSPAANATVPGNTLVTLSANATANLPATVANVAFFVDGLQVGVDTTSPYAVTWTAATAGLRTITAVVTDSNGLAATSAGVSVTVSAVNSPTIAMTAPTAGTSVFVGANVTVSATAAPGSSGAITKVDFYAITL